MDMDSFIWYLIVGFVSGKGAVRATPDISLYRLWWWVDRGCLEGLWWMVTHVVCCLCLRFDVFRLLSVVWCLVSVVWCLVSGDVWISKRAPSPFFCLAVSPKARRAHWYHLPSMLQAVIAIIMMQASDYNDTGSRNSSDGNGEEILWPYILSHCTEYFGRMLILKFWKLIKRDFTGS